MYCTKNKGTGNECIGEGNGWENGVGLIGL